MIFPEEKGFDEPLGAPPQQLVARESQWLWKHASTLSVEFIREMTLIRVFAGPLSQFRGQAGYIGAKQHTPAASRVHSL